MNVERFWSKVAKSDGCWEWQGVRSLGYGMFNDNRRRYSAHRASYALAYGDFPAELNVLHRCDNPACVRPDHLFLGTHADNVHDMDAKGRRVRKQSIVGRQCRHGHAMTPENTIMNLSHGYRIPTCRICRNEQNRLARRNKKQRRPVLCLPGVLVTDSWAGRARTPVIVVDETRTRYRITPGPGVDAMRLGGRRRWLHAGQLALVPRHAVTLSTTSSVDTALCLVMGGVV